MPYWALIEGGVVMQVRKAEHDYVAANPHIYQGVWIEVQNPQQYPAQGWTYAEGFGFRPPKPYSSWQWDDLSRLWSAPAPRPDDGQEYVWDDLMEAWTPLIE